MRWRRLRPLWSGQYRWHFALLVIASLISTCIVVRSDDADSAGRDTPWLFMAAAILGCLNGLALGAWLRGWVASVLVWLLICLALLLPLPGMVLIGYTFCLAWAFYGTLIIVLADVVVWLIRHFAPQARLP